MRKSKFTDSQVMDALKRVDAGLAERLKGTASIGIQQNLNYAMGNYQASSVLMGQNFSAQMPSNTNSMVTASAGL